jgi:hypothetical protein
VLDIVKSKELWRTAKCLVELSAPAMNLLSLADSYIPWTGREGGTERRREGQRDGGRERGREEGTTGGTDGRTDGRRDGQTAQL